MDLENSFAAWIDKAGIWLSKPWIGSAIGIVGIILGIIIAWFVYRKSMQPPKFNWSKEKQKILGSSTHKLPDDVEILFKGEKVNSLARTRFAVWNSGYKTIKGEDISELDKLRVKFDPEAKLLDVTILKVSRDVIRATVTLCDEGENELQVTFDFMDGGDGLLFDVLHVDSKNEGKVIGTIKGVSEGILEVGVVGGPPRVVGWLLGILLLVAAIGLATIAVWELFYSPNPAELGNVFFGILSSLGAFVFGVFGIAVIAIRRRYPNTLKISQVTLNDKLRQAIQGK